MSEYKKRLAVEIMFKMPYFLTPAQQRKWIGKYLAKRLIWT